MTALATFAALLVLTTSPSIAGSPRATHLVGEDELEAAGGPAASNERQALMPQASAHEQLARLQDLLDQRRELLASKPGFGAPIGMLVGSVVAAPVSVLFLNLSVPLLSYVGAGGGFWGGLLSVFVVLAFAVGIIAGVAHVVLGALFGPTLSSRIQQREKHDRKVKELEDEIEAQTRLTEQGSAP